MERIDIITDNREPITSYEKAKFQIVDFKSVYIICGSTTYDDGWEDDGDIDGEDDDYYDGD